MIKIELKLPLHNRGVSTSADVIQEAVEHQTEEVRDMLELVTCPYHGEPVEILLVKGLNGYHINLVRPCCPKLTELVISVIVSFAPTSSTPYLA